MADAWSILRRLAPRAALSVTMGDQALFEAVVAALGLPSGWQKRLIHAFGNTALLDQLIARLANPARTLPVTGPAASLIASGDEAALSGHIAAVMEETGYSTHASRAPEEIARRMIEKVRLEEIRLSDKALAALRAFLALETPLSGALAALTAFADGAGLDIAAARDGFARRVAALEASDLDLAAVTWRAAFGRPLDYYTGLVFEVAAGHGGPVLAGGGRYDRMMALLGARDPIPAVGFSLWVDRIETARSSS